MNKKREIKKLGEMYDKGSSHKNDYNHFLQDVLTKIQQARYEMLMSASKQTLLLYWDIGKMVSEKMQNAGWGKSIVEQLAKDLQTEFPGIRGFSARNIWRMKMFAEFYAQFKISATAVAEIQSDKNSATAVALNVATTVAELHNPIYELITNIGWVQNCIILEKCKDLNTTVIANCPKNLPNIYLPKTNLTKD